MNIIFQTLAVSFFFIVILSVNLFAQNNEIEFKHLSTEQELSTTYVWDIIQDRYGFMWFGTFDGLDKFDGYTFRVFRHDPQDSNSLSNNRVHSIYEDRSGTLWIGTFEGLNRFDRQRNSFTHYQNDPQDPRSISSNSVLSIYEDRSGALWIGTEDGGLNLFDRQGEFFIRYQNDPQNPGSLSNNRVSAIYEDRSGALWIGTSGIGTSGGLNLFDRQGNSFKRYKHDPKNPNSLSGNFIFAIYEDRSGRLWIGTTRGLNLFDRQSNSFTHYRNDPKNSNSLSHDVVWSIYEDQAGALWIGTENGLNLFDGKSKSFKRYHNDPQNSNSLSSNTVYSIYQDRSGVLWISCAGTGLNLVDGQSRSFMHYQYDSQNPNSVSNNNIWTIYEDRTGALWIGTDGGGLNLFDRKSQSFTRYQNDVLNPKSLSSNLVAAIYEDRAGALWIGTTGGLNLFDRKSQSFERYLPGAFANAIHEDRTGALWIGISGSGLRLFDRQSKSFTSYQNDPQDSNSLSSDYVNTMYEDRSGGLWIGTKNGLNLFDRKSQSFIRYRNDPQNRNSLSNNFVWGIIEDLSGALWIGTDGGLNLLDRATGEFKHLRAKDGLPSDAVEHIFADDIGNLWISCPNGVSVFSPGTSEFRNYDILDGLHGPLCKTRDGMMYFSGNGMTVIHPDSIRHSPFVPPVLITELLLFNKPVLVGADYEGFVLPQSITTSDELVLSYREAVFTLEFSALCFVNPKKQKYAYRLEGFDKDWVFTDAKRRFATYTNLTPGKYVFHVKGSNHDGIWNEEGRSLRIIITPPWWMTTWAYALYILFGLSLIYSLRRYELNRLRLKNQVKLDEVKLQEKEETNRIKSQFFANISHEFRTPLTLILGPAESLNRNSVGEEIEKQTNVIKRNARRLLGLINQLLDLSKLEAGKLQLKASLNNIVAFVKGITMSFESVAQRKDISLKVNSTREELEVYFDRDMMVKVLTNLLSNAFKFTPDGGAITVSIDTNPPFNSPFTKGGKEEGSVEIKIKDTGIGISEEELPKLFDRFYQVDSSQTREFEGTGLGLALTKELVELHRGSIKVESKLGEGSEFIVTLPLGKTHLEEDEIVEAVEIPKESKVIDESIYTKKTELVEDSTLQETSDDKNLILVVEDNADVREYIKDSLGNSFLFEEAVNGEQGLRKATQIIPDLIISDIMMPKMDGNEFTRRVKNDEKTSHIPVILLTAKSEQESKLEGLETGADDYLIKPFDTKELLIRIKNLITIRKNLQQKISQGMITKQKDRPKLSSIDEKFMSRAIEVVESHLSEEEFSIEQFGDEIGMSRMQLHRKLKALTGKSASLYLRSVRLAKAKEMIEKKEGNIAEIAYSVGFSSPAYFSACFREEYGYPPSEIVH